MEVVLKRREKLEGGGEAAQLAFKRASEFDENDVERAVVAIHADGDAALFEWS